MIASLQSGLVSRVRATTGLSSESQISQLLELAAAHLVGSLPPFEARVVTHELPLWLAPSKSTGAGLETLDTAIESSLGVDPKAARELAWRACRAVVTFLPDDARALAKRQLPFLWEHDSAPAPHVHSLNRWGH